VLGWHSYVVAALTLNAATAGLLHADAHRSPRTLAALDREVAARFSEGLASVFERAVLRETLQRHRSQLQTAVQWMSGRLGRLAAQTPIAGVPPTSASTRAVEALTRRELEVLRLMAGGHTNVGIARALLVGEGTVKYHVKNVLRKLGATSRPDAGRRPRTPAVADGALDRAPAVADTPDIGPPARGRAGAAAPALRGTLPGARTGARRRSRAP
jgi:LuxR family transcriptional regulator, regulator of acetate metabolism